MSAMGGGGTMRRAMEASRVRWARRAVGVEFSSQCLQDFVAFVKCASKQPSSSSSSPGSSACLRGRAVRVDECVPLELSVPVGASAGAGESGCCTLRRLQPAAPPPATCRARMVEMGPGAAPTEAVGAEASRGLTTPRRSPPLASGFLRAFFSLQ